MSKVHISELSAAEIPGVMRIQLESNIVSWSADSYQNEISKLDSVSLCIKRSEDLIGFIISRLLVDSDGSSEAEILNFAISGEFQNRGYGHSLFCDLVSRLSAKNVRCIWLEVRSSNIGARGFYEKQGFTFQFHRKNYYSDPAEDALVMKKHLFSGSNF